MRTSMERAASAHEARSVLHPTPRLTLNLREVCEPAVGHVLTAYFASSASDFDVDGSSLASVSGSCSHVRKESEKLDISLSLNFSWSGPGAGCGAYNCIARGPRPIPSQLEQRL